MDIIERITKTIEPSLDSMGYRLVLVKLGDAAKRKTLTIMAERLDDVMMSFDDCGNISQTVSALLDVEDPITSAYDLEVSSPGVDRPLTRLEDFDKYNGFEAKCETLLPIDGRKRFKGKIDGRNGSEIIMKTEEGTVAVPFNHIKAAKLVMTDELLSEFLRKQKKQKQAQKQQNKQKKA